MASYRTGIGSFNLKDGNIGIGTETTGFGNLKVEGTIKTNDLDVGVSTFTRYSGFEAEQTNIIRDQTLSGEYSTTGDMLGSFTGDINHSNAELKVTMASAGIATVTTFIDKITI